MSWILVANLVNLRSQIDAWAPDRDHASDGTIGDAAHQREASGHNPDDTPGSLADYNDHDGIAEVRAFDCDVNFNNGGTAQQVVDHIRSLSGVSRVIRYMIYNRTMYHVRDGFAPTPYTGSNPHTDHIHFESAWTQYADTSNSFDYRMEDILVALTAADRLFIENTVQAMLVQTPLNGPDGKPDGTFTTDVGHNVLSQGVPDETLDGGPRKAYYQAFGNLATVIMNIKTSVANIENILESMQHGQ